MSTPKRVVYVLNARVPSNNGHVLQSVHMCSGFAEAGFDTTLCYSNRAQLNTDLEGIDVFEYFDIDESFKTKALPHIDMMQYYAEYANWLIRPAIVGCHLIFFLVSLVQSWRENGDLFVTREWPIAVLFSLFGFPTVLEMHKTEGKSFSRRGRRAVGSVADRDAFRGVVTLTEPSAEGLSELGIPRDKILVEPDAVSLADYQELPSKASARDRLDVEDDRFVAGYTGSLHRGKGVRPLIEASRGTDWTVLVVGGTDEERATVQSEFDSGALDAVRFVGRVPPTEVSWYQRACDVLVLSPTREAGTTKHHPDATSPLKMFEYMAAERPIVASKLPGIESVLTPEESALLVEPGDVESLHRVIERLRQNQTLANRLAETAATRVENYTWEKRAERIAKAFL